MRGVDKLRIAVAVGIFCLWAGATIFDAYSTGYEVPNNLQNLMMLVAGFLFTPAVIKAARNRSDDDQE